MTETSSDSHQTATFSSRIVQFFFMHLGSFAAVIIYFILCERTAYSPSGVQAALLTGLIVMSGYIALAYFQDELKQFDYGLWAMFALGTLGAYAGISSVFALFRHYSAAMLFFTLGLVALIPLLLGYETFTYYFARRQVPRWQQKMAVFDTINRVMTGYWAFLFFIAAGLATWAPQDWRFTALYPNLLIFVLGIPATSWLPSLYLKVFPPESPQSIEPVLMGMPFSFDQKAAGDAQATIQFCISGTEAGSYHLRIAQGKCESFEGRASSPDLTVHTPDTVWLRIVHGELDGTQAFQEGLYHIEGDLSLLIKMQEWFPRQP